MICKSPNVSDIPRLKALWKEVFGDSESFLEGFFSVAFDTERVRVAVVDNKLVAALYIFDCSLKGEKLSYIYAVQTNPRFRGRGICRELFTDTHHYLKSCGYKGALLVPSNDPLAFMYEKFGYTVCGKEENENITAAQNKKIPLRKISSEEYDNIRKKMLPDNAVLQEGISTLFLAQNQELFSGEDTLFSVFTEDRKLIFSEFLGNKEILPNIVYTLGFKEAVLKKTRFMYLPFYKNSPKPDYFGLSFE